MQTGLKLSDFSKSDKKFRSIYLALLRFQICVSLDFFVPSTIPIWRAGGQERWKYFNSDFFSSSVQQWAPPPQRGILESPERADATLYLRLWWLNLCCVLHHEVRLVACYIMRWDKLTIEDTKSTIGSSYFQSLFIRLYNFFAHMIWYQLSKSEAGNEDDRGKQFHSFRNYS